MEIHEIVVFLVAAAIGGLTRPLISNDGILRTPGYDKVKRQLDFGFFSDMLVGVVAATAALIVGMAFLRALLPTNGDGLAVNLVTDRWVYLASFGSLVGFGGGRLLPALSQRVIDAIDDQVEKRTEQVKKDATQVSAGATESLLEKVQGLQQAVADLSKGSPGAALTAPKEPAQAIEDLIACYDALNEPDYRVRLKRKSEIYQSMVGVCSAQNVDPIPLLQKLEAASGSDAYGLAIAAWVAARPNPGTGDLLLGAAAKVTRLHVKYQTASVLGLLATASRLSREEARRASLLLDAFAKDADPPLMRRIEATLAAIRAVAPDVA